MSLIQYQNLVSKGHIQRFICFWGKDSLATWLLAVEAGINHSVVFADTGHEHPQTMEYLDYLEMKLGRLFALKPISLIVS
jgi:3'-phosphoadenosine 5'-phosphosulfate sulfotransferase (PAPS reductase)/FAD synthetase